MRKVVRDEILDYVTYDEQRDAIREAIFKVKAPRRIHLGDCLTFLFENADTMRYQVLEMVRAEKIVKEEDIQREISTYNDLLGGPGELSCSLLIEIDDPTVRKEKLRRWLDLPKQVYLRLEDDTKVRPTYDVEQVGDDRLSAVQYLKFPVGEGRPVAVGVDLDDLQGEVELTGDQRAALLADLAS